MDCRDVILKAGWVLGRPDHKARWLARIWSSGGELHSNNSSLILNRPRSYVLVHDSREVCVVGNDSRYTRTVVSWFRDAGAKSVYT